METFLIVLLLLFGLALVTFGANWLVDGSSDIAKRIGISDFVVGLTIVAIGTSSPEIVVSFLSAIQGNSDISVGNVVGSNIFNAAIILGLTAVLSPVLITSLNRRVHVPVNVLATFLFILFCYTGNRTITRFEGVIFLIILLAYYIWTIKSDRQATKLSSEAPQKPSRHILLSILLIVSGLGALIWGGELFVDNARKIAALLDVSDKVIAVTVIATGTSLPELATSIVAAAKGSAQMALGNLIGSNTINILFVLGGAALIHPLQTNGMGLLDQGALVLSAILLLIFTNITSKEIISKIEGALLLLLGLVYMGLCIAL